MRSNLKRRLEKLESSSKLQVKRVIHYGWVKPRDKSATSPRRLIIVSSQPTGSPNVFWSQFEDLNDPKPE